MKPPGPKLHFTIRDAPLNSLAFTVEALCGEEVHPAEICFVWDSQQVNQPLNIPVIGTCSKCGREMFLRVHDEPLISLGQSKVREYVYGIRRAN